jgi:hypothetical protein
MSLLGAASPSFFRERHEHDMFLQLLKSCYGLQERLTEASSGEEIELLADLASQNLWRCIQLMFVQMQRGPNGSRADDTKGMKGVILDWIMPPGEKISPYISKKAKYGRGFNHDVTGALLCPTGLDWSDPR